MSGFTPNTGTTGLCATNNAFNCFRAYRSLETRMPHYFFDIHDGIHVHDNEGKELPDLEAAKAEAIRLAGGFATRPAMLGEDGGAMVVVIRDAPDSVVLNVRLVFNVEEPWRQRQRVPVAPT
ncbi:hypothetical protein [Methylobacterium sp. WL9]|uniref:DUF6894 family protein n=1 Tax=Methylobacterium sp. WL9 TaxID=2603898 RepID=UPI0011DB11A5|nr:hypothetical protein [Methylobacterium sp. WL9]TXN19964.1 hypothetical protein FV217_19615 [Methylobacterium sp. WL9]